MTKFHCILVVILGVINATHHTLIIPKEENRQSSHAIDSNEEATLLKLVDDVGPRNHIHNGVGPRGLVELGIKKVTDKLCALQRMWSKRGPSKERRDGTPG